MLPDAPPQIQTSPDPSRPWRVVLDTNVVVDVFLFASELSQPLAALLASGDAHCYTSPDTLAELQRVLAYPALKASGDKQAEVLHRYQAIARHTEIPPSTALPPLPRCRDADDQKFLELAAHIGADWLISRDRELLRLARQQRPAAPFRIVDTGAFGVDVGAWEVAPTVLAKWAKPATKPAAKTPR